MCPIIELFPHDAVPRLKAVVEAFSHAFELRGGLVIWLVLL